MRKKDDVRFSCTNSVVIRGRGRRPSLLPIVQSYQLNIERQGINRSLEPLELIELIVNACN